jgi:ABC-2 type transport system permease protein
MREILHAEWTKLRTDGATLWLLSAGAAGLSIALSAGVLSSVTCPAPGCTDDPTRLSLTGVMIGQAVVAILAVMAIGGEYSTGMIRVTLTAMPRRSAMLAAKAVVLAGVAAVTGTVAVLGSLAAGRFILPGNGFGPENGFSALSLTDGPTLRAAVGSVLYLVLIALLSLGAATAVRDSATGVGIVLGLLYVFPIITHVITNPEWQRHLQQIAPMSAGLSVQTTRDVAGQPIGPWAGLGVLAAWAAAALVAGGLLLRQRDA